MGLGSNRVKQATAFLLFFLFFCTPIFSAEVLSVMPLDTTSGVSEADVTLINSYLESEFVATKKYRVIAKESRETILAEQKFTLSGCTDQSCAVDIGKMLSANYIVIGSVNKHKNTYIVSIKMVSVES